MPPPHALVANRYSQPKYVWMATWRGTSASVPWSGRGEQAVACIESHVARSGERNQTLTTPYDNDEPSAAPGSHTIVRGPTHDTAKLPGDWRRKVWNGFAMQ